MSILLEELSKTYGATTVVDGVNLSVREGELFVLLGGSGSGKSTILRMIAGLTAPNRGKIFLHGNEVTKLPPQSRETGFVFQNYSLFKSMTVGENIAFGLDLRGHSQTEQSERVAELLDLVDMPGLERRFPDQLSGGQKQRVALARALAYRPKVLLLDEPFGALDVQIRARLRRSLKEIQQHLGVTTVLVTHDQEEAMELGDRIAIMRRGRLLEVAEPGGLYHRPRTEVAASFLGGGNVLYGAHQADRVRVGEAWVRPSAPVTAGSDGLVRLMVRPAALSVRLQPASPDEGLQELGFGIITGSVFVGASRRLTVQLEGGPEVEAMIPSERDGVALHTRVWIGAREFHPLEADLPT